MAGRLRLAATGVQDRWLTEDPQFSHFLVNFKRHTKFALDYVESHFDGDLDFGKTIVCRIPGDKGDLIRNVNLKMTLTDPLPVVGGASNWVQGIGSQIMEYVELVIGGQVIERITGEYISIHQQLHNTNDDTEQSLYFLSGHQRQLPFPDTYTYYVDLPFYFYRHPSLSIPTCALTKQQVEIVIKLKPLEKLISGGKAAFDALGGPYVWANIQGSINRMSIDTEFIYVTDDERNYLKSNPIDYLITQVQMSTFVMKAGETEKSVMLNFKHPVREMYFVSQMAYNQNEDNYPYILNKLSNVELRFNDQVVFNRDGLFMMYQNQFMHHTNCSREYTNGGVTIPFVFGTYSFSLNPEVHYPTGQVNMSRISHKLLKMKIDIDPSDVSYTKNNRVYAINYNILRFESGLAGLKF